MAAGNFTIYGNAKESVLKGAINLNSDNFQMVLTSGSYTPNDGTDSTYANVSGYEVSGSGYTAGGAALASPAVSYTSGTETAAWTTGSGTWANSTITAAYAIIVHKASTSLASTDLLIGYVALNTASAGATIGSTNGTFEVSPNAAGWFTLD